MAFDRWASGSIDSTSLNRFLIMSPATSSGEGTTTMARLCLTRPILRKGGVTRDRVMDPVWQPRREACNYYDRIGVIIIILIGTHIN